MAITHVPLPPASRKQLEKALIEIEKGDTAVAEALLVVALAKHPGHPRLLHGLGALQLRRGYFDLAAATLAEARAGLPASVELLVCLSTALARNNQFVEALTVLESAADQARTIREWLLAGVAADQQGRHELASLLATRALAPDPRHAQALLLRARSAQVLGRIADAARDYRAAATQPGVAAKAWFALADLKTVKIEASDLSAMARVSNRDDLGL
ncbi:MAG: tetratricopeptide repeat protein, partial [Deltaproteobacteria bacterium]|nr:tetratricopeptide repeat protein [Deltaproteobacteria bacterium]